jgi:hypothetical protein
MELHLQLQFGGGVSGLILFYKQSLAEPSILLYPYATCCIFPFFFFFPYFKQKLVSPVRLRHTRLEQEGDMPPDLGH